MHLVRPTCLTRPRSIHSRTSRLDKEHQKGSTGTPQPAELESSTKKSKPQILARTCSLRHFRNYRTGLRRVASSGSEILAVYKVFRSNFKSLLHTNNHPTRSQHFTQQLQRWADNYFPHIIADIGVTRCRSTRSIMIVPIPSWAWLTLLVKIFNRWV
jgi:hypothetical protein